MGDPVEHSLSPVLHQAAYRALGLDGWSYDRTRVRVGELAEHVRGLGPEWVGVSVTMPGKEEALALADHATSRARLTGSANTLTRTDGHWQADNTDVEGLQEALAEAAGGPGPWDPRSAVVVGSGATARSALAALHALGVREISCVVRDAVRPATLALAERLGLDLRTIPASAQMAAWGAPDVVVSTVPAGATPAVDGPGGLVSAVVLDVVYAGWPTPWGAALAGHGVHVHRGDTMLLHQAAGQVRLMTGRPAPLAAMRHALAAALDLGRGALAGPERS